jgi:hypothetical protein
VKDAAETQVSPDELYLRAREGDADAAYALLAEQVPVDHWVAAIEALGRQPAVDLEVVAHRTLRRKPQAVPRAVVSLARTVATPEAAFVARAIVILRDEDHVTREAAAVAEELCSEHDPAGLLADERARDALFALLARPLPEQAAFVTGLESDRVSLALLLDAARVEYLRLQELSRDTRWRSGSYRHALRHALADLALLAAAGGDFEHLAFRLLQQRTDDPGANQQLLALLPEATRAAYLDWVLSRPAGKEDVERALFVLEELERAYLDEVGRDAVRPLLSSAELAIARRAAELLVRSDPTDATVDRRIAEIVRELPTAESDDLVRAVATGAPSRVRLDLWPVDSDLSIASAGRPLAPVLVETIERSEDERVTVRALDVLIAIDAEEELLVNAVSAILDRSRPSASSDLMHVLEHDGLRRALWAALDAAESASEEVVGLLVARSTPTAAAIGLEQLSRGHPSLATEVALAGVESGTVDPYSLGDLGNRIASRAKARLVELTSEREELAERAAEGEAAAEAQLEADIAPLISHARTRLTGNERLLRDLDSIAGSRKTPARTAPSSSADDAALNRVATQLEKYGVSVEASSEGYVARVVGEADDVAALKALALLDQQATSIGGELVDQLRGAVAEALARAGLGARCMSDLYSGGPLQHPVMLLSAESRVALFDAAVACGATVLPDWESHPILSRWVSADDTATDAGSDAAGEDALPNLAAVAAEVRDLRSRVATLRHEARIRWLDRVHDALRGIDDAADAQLQLWLGLQKAGIDRVAVPGVILAASDLDAAAFEVVGEADGERYLVRSGGLRVGSDVIERARVEAVR